MLCIYRGLYGSRWNRRSGTVWSVAYIYSRMYRVVQKTDTQFYFWDNFGNSAPILTILSLLQEKFMARKREVLPPTAPLLCDHIT